MMRKKIFWCLAVFFSILLVLFIVLKIGFGFDSIKTHLFSAEKLYIKLDTKLTLKAKKIKIFESNDTNSTFELHQLVKIVQGFEYLYFFFDEISVDSIERNGQSVALKLKDREFVAENDYFSLKLGVEKNASIIIADIKELILKGLEANVSADLAIDTNFKHYLLNGELNSTKASFDFALFFNPQELKFELQNVEINNIKSIFAYLKRNKVPLGENVTAWVSRKAAAQYYHFDFVRGALAFDKKTQITTLDGQGYAKGLVVKLDESIEDISIPFVDMNLSKEKLAFDFDKALFNGKDLSESEIFIFDIANPEKNGISVGIKSNELLLDEKLQDLLRYYGIKIPLTQLSGSMKSDFIIKLPFSNPANNDYKGDFELTNAQFDSANLFVHNGKVRLENGKLWLDEFSVSNDFLSSDLNASLDLNARTGVFDTQISQIYFENLLNFGNKFVRLDLSYKDDIVLNSKEWGLELNLTNGLTIKSSKLMKFKPYSPILQSFGVQGVMNFYLDTKDFVSFNVDLHNVRFENELLKSNAQPYESDDIFIRKKGANIAISTSSGLLGVQMRDKHIIINAKDLGYRIKDSAELGKSGDYDIDLKASNFALFLDDFEKTLSFDSLNLSILDGAIEIKASKDKALLSLIKNKNELKLDYTGVDDKTLNEFMRKKVVENGKFAIHIKGANEKNFEGNIVFSNTYIKGLKLHNQLISFIDTIPSLVLFKNPTFNEKGLKVKKGAIVFTRANRNLFVNGLTFDGDSVDVLGIGNVDLEKSRLKLELELRALKSTTEAIAKVPIVNQIILGKDRVISTQIIVDGKLDEPKFHTQIIKETLKLPLNLFKNIVELPGLLLK